MKEPPTHFIEQYGSGNLWMHTGLIEIKHLNECLELTKKSPDVKTIAVFKIKFKK